MTEQDVIANVEQEIRNAQARLEAQDDAALNQAFSRQNQTDWMRSLRRVARAQAILWHETPIAERQVILARVDQETEALKK